MVFFKYIIINILHKSDTCNNNNYNNNNIFSTVLSRSNMHVCRTDILDIYSLKSPSYRPSSLKMIEACVLWTIHIYIYTNILVFMNVCVRPSWNYILLSSLVFLHTWTEAHTRLSIKKGSEVHKVWVFEVAHKYKHGIMPLNNVIDLTFKRHMLKFKFWRIFSRSK